MVIPNAGADVAFITEEQMREVDRAMVEDLGILLVQMMEHAGRGLAAVARSRFFAGDPRGKRVLVLAGSGGNGGGGICARSSFELSVAAASSPPSRTWERMSATIAGTSSPASSCADSSPPPRSSASRASIRCR